MKVIFNSFLISFFLTFYLLAVFKAWGVLW